MANPTGELKLKARGKEYTLHLGMSVLADLQEQWGDKLDELLSPSKGRTPNLKVMHSVFAASLERHHPEADRWTVDDIIAENANAFADLLATAFPDAGEESEGTGKKKAAA